MQMRDDVTADAQCVGLILGEVITQAGDPRMHVGTAEGFIVGVFIDRHLHQWRPAQVHPRGILLQHHVIAHPRHIRTTSGA